ncbi:prohead protease [Staphylococcus phage vB_SauM_VL10]|nr:prohead protease [Staphylococcus phage vB_SauM_VL10]
METKFKAYMPLDVETYSNEDNTDKDVYFEGYCSVPVLDRQQDIVDPKGVDIDMLMSDGWVTFEHERDKVIGIPTEGTKVTQKGVYLVAKIFKEDQYAREMINLAENLKKSGSNRKLGFSIEGVVKSRDTRDNRVITGLSITGVSVVKVPANQESRLDVVLKSFLTGTETTPDTQVDAGALRKESLASAITNLTYVTKIKDVKEYNDIWNNVVEDLTKSNNMGYEESVITLQLAKGLSRKDAEIAVMNINKKNLE